MLNGVKNFAIDKVLRHVADNAKLNATTNGLALAAVLYAIIQANANWMLMFQCCAAPGSLQEVVRVAAGALVALLLFLTGKFPGLKQWLPVAQEIIGEAEKEAVAAPTTKGA